MNDYVVQYKFFENRHCILSKLLWSFCSFT